MKKTILCFIVFLASTFAAKAQMTYTVGTLTLTVIPNFSHDSTWCQSNCVFLYNIQKSTSFLNDSIVIKDQVWGLPVYYFVNTTGASPWNTSAPMTYGGIQIVSDANLMQPGNFAYFGMNQYKAINGTDTIYNINNNYGQTVTNPCSYDTVRGRVYVDQNNDCIYNAGDIGLQSLNLNYDDFLSNSSPGSFTSAGNSGFGGSYFLQVQKSWMTSYRVYVPSEYQFIFPSTACSPLSYSFTSLPQNNVDFSLQCGSVIDVQTWIGSPGFARPLVPFSLSPVVSNTGCDSASGVLKLVLDSRVVYTASLSANPATSVNGDTLYWNYTNLTNLSAGAYWNSFFAGVYLTPNGTVNSGDTLCFKSIINIPANDLNAANNMYSMCIPVVNSHDPNFKEVAPAGSGAQGNIPASTPDLTYTIHFQNTGSAVAFDINIVDTLSSNVNASSLQIIESSHAMTPSWLAAGVVQFRFQNIYLADSTSNEPASHGFVTFKVNLNSALSPGTQITNRGDIYFDNNSAILTNVVLNTIQSGVGIAENLNGNFEVFPNPASANISVRLAKAGQAVVIMNDILGNEIRRFSMLTDRADINVESLQSGIYFISLLQNKDRLVKKIVISR